jgi:hypothetical protein
MGVCGARYVEMREGGSLKERPYFGNLEEM